MAMMSSLFRRAAFPAVVPFALRAISSPRIVLNTSIAAEQGESSCTSIPRCYFSTVADAKNKIIDIKLVKLLRSDIKSAKQLDWDNPKRMPSAPADFPFTIEDIPGQNSITLTSELFGEKIQVNVNMPMHSFCRQYPDFTSDDDVSDRDGDVSNSYDDCSDGDEKDVPMTVKIIKQSGKTLEFGLDASPGGIEFYRIEIQEPEIPDIINEIPCKEMDKDLEYALSKFLERRGINKSNTEFLYQYMVRKNQRDALLMLKKLKKFVKA